MRRHKPTLPSIANVTVRCLDVECGKEGLMIRIGPEVPYFHWSIPFFNWLFAYYACATCRGRKIEAIPPAVSTDEKERASLSSLLGELNDEITRYRDHEWQLLVWHVGVTWGLYLASNTIRSSMGQTVSAISDIMFGCLVLIATALLGSHLVFVHGELTTNRNWRRQIERALGYYSATSILPSKWASSVVQYKQGRDTFIIPFLLFMWISGLGVVYLLGWQHEMFPFIARWDAPFIWAWQYGMAVIIGILVILEVSITAKAIYFQGLGSSGPF